MLLPLEHPVSCCMLLGVIVNTDAASHLLGLNNSSIRIKLKSFEKVASSLFTIRSLDSPHECYPDFYTGVPLLRMPPLYTNHPGTRMLLR